MLERVKKRLESFGYALKDGDEAALVFSIQKVENTIKNDCILKGLIWILW